MTTKSTVKSTVSASIINSSLNARYAYRHGIVVADDLFTRAIQNSVLPLDGAFIFRLRQPVNCVMITYGYGGVLLPDTGLCVIGDAWNQVTKQESFALHRLMTALDPGGKYQIRSNWMLLDMVATEAKIIRRPTDREVALLGKASTRLKESDRALYKIIQRVARRRSTSGVDILDGHENDSDKDPFEVMLDDMIAKEQRYLKARADRLYPWPDNEAGVAMHKLEMRRKRESNDPKMYCTGKRPRGRPPGKRPSNASQSGATLRKPDVPLLLCKEEPVDLSPRKEEPVDLQSEDLKRQRARKRAYAELFGDDDSSQDLIGGGGTEANSGLFETKAEKESCSAVEIVRQRRAVKRRRAQPPSLPPTPRERRPTACLSGTSTRLPSSTDYFEDFKLDSDDEARNRVTEDEEEDRDGREIDYGGDDD